MSNTERTIKQEIKLQSKERSKSRDKDGRRIIRMTVDDES